ncbi:hypothetical protein ABZW30_24970 [Kitasatospora sp. NPDC004669]|uniref:hypothetical protein n=1 Tax=Kitasatospora sp. NPDC004669 TaxID=3154555 RepID=UPI0033A6C920
MTPLGLSVATWWCIAVLVTAVFWAVVVTLQPTREYRILAALAPFAGALFLLGHYKVKGMDPADALLMYSSAILAFPLGLVGHVRKLSERALEAQREGRPADQGVLTPGVMVQLFLALVGGMVTYFVLKV